MGEPQGPGITWAASSGLGAAAGCLSELPARSVQPWRRHASAGGYHAQSTGLKQGLSPWLLHWCCSSAL